MTKVTVLLGSIFCCGGGGGGGGGGSVNQDRLGVQAALVAAAPAGGTGQRWSLHEWRRAQQLQPPPPPPQLQPLSERWKPHQFNGMTYCAWGDDLPAAQQWVFVDGQIKQGDDTCLLATVPPTQVKETGQNLTQ